MMLAKPLITTVLVLWTATGCAPPDSALAGHVGQPAPAFSLVALDGRQISLSQLRGKVVVLDFWATWCPPCREALPHLQALSGNAEKLQRGLIVLAVNEQEDASTIRAFVEENHYTFTVLPDVSGSAGNAYGVTSLPQTVIVGRDGLIQADISGWTPDAAHQIDQAVAAALDAPIR